MNTSDINKTILKYNGMVIWGEGLISPWKDYRLNRCIDGVLKINQVDDCGYITGDMVWNRRIRNVIDAYVRMLFRLERYEDETKH